MKIVATITALILGGVGETLWQIACRYHSERLVNISGGIAEYSDRLYWKHNTKCINDYAGEKWI